jgi:hypothetical protein
MSSPELPTSMRLSNSARMPASLTSRHNPRNGWPPVANSTVKPVVMRGSRYTNLRMSSKPLVPVGPLRLWPGDEHADEMGLLYLSARRPIVSMPSAKGFPGLPERVAGAGGPHAPFLKRKAHTQLCPVLRCRKSGSSRLRLYRISNVTVTSMIDTRCSE